ncbi:MAG: pilus assembly protein TadG-related protein, partial [Phascolarctobacterium sp.]
MVFFALLLPILFGFMGLGFDVSMLYVNKGKLQDVADAAALAGAAHIGEDGDGIKHAVEAYAKANGLQITENELVSVANDSWSSLGELGENENVRVAYGVVTVNDRPRLRVRVDKRVLMPFISVLAPSWEKGMPVMAVAAAEGETGDEPVFRIIGRNGVYDHFFNLAGSGSDENGNPTKWINGSIYAGNMLRASYKQHNPQEARNMISVDGYIFADMMNTGLPLEKGVTGTVKKPSDDRIIRSDYVRKKNGDTWLSGLNALTPTNFKASGWNKTAKEMAEQTLASYSAELQRMIADGSIKQ